MAQTPLGNIGLEFEHTLGVDDWKNSYDANWVRLDSLAGQSFVVDHLITAEPVSPAVGDAYILGAIQTGTNWGTDTGAVPDAIALFTSLPGQTDSSPWLYITPRENWRLYDRTNNVWMRFNGTIWFAESGVHNSDVSGYAADPNIDFHYSIANKSVTIRFPLITGTSDATTKNLITAMPTFLRPARAQNCLIVANDNAGGDTLAQGIVGTDGDIDFFTDANSGAWTATGTALIRAGTISYNLE